MFGNAAASSETVRPTSPQPNSSRAIAWSRASTCGGMSSEAASNPIPDVAAVATNSQYEEPGATASSALSLSRAVPAGRITSRANLCIACWTARSSSPRISKPLVSTCGSAGRTEAVASRSCSCVITFAPSYSRRLALPGRGNRRRKVPFVLEVLQAGDLLQGLGDGGDPEQRPQPGVLAGETGELGIDKGVVDVLDHLAHRRDRLRRALRDVTRQSVRMGLQLAARQRTVDDAVGGSLLTGEVAGRQEHLAGPGRADLHRQPRGAAACGHDPAADLGQAEPAFRRGETHVRGEQELQPAAPADPVDHADGHLAKGLPGGR